jgi:hypothetical protein
MLVTRRLKQSHWVRVIPYFVVLAVFCAFPASRAKGQSTATAASSATASPSLTIPVGTVLPVVLRTTISPNKLKQGDKVYGQIAQDVPLPNRSKIRKGSRVEGEVVSVAPGSNASGTQVSIRFDKLYSEGHPIPITTDLRAIAGFMEVFDATTPNTGAGESEVYDWLTTTQIGGDSVFGRGGTVASAHDTGKVVGKSLMSGGVLVEVSANEQGRCRGALDDNNNPQALWVFSSDACGTYGLSKVNITHKGRTQPVGTFTLDMQDPKVKIQSGAGLLLRVIS